MRIGEAKRLINSYYESQSAHEASASQTGEADKVSAHIAETLAEEAFVFTLGQLVSIRRRLFDGVYDLAGVICSYNISE